MMFYTETLNPLGFQYPEGIQCNPCYPGVPLYIAQLPSIQGPILPPSNVEQWKTDVEMTDSLSASISSGLGIFQTFPYGRMNFDTPLFSIQSHEKSNKEKFEK